MIILKNFFPWETYTRKHEGIYADIIYRACIHLVLFNWMDVLRFYVLFSSILVMSGQWTADNETLWAWNSVCNWQDPRLRQKENAFTRIPWKRLDWLFGKREKCESKRFKARFLKSSLSELLYNRCIGFTLSYPSLHEEIGRDLAPRL